MASSSTQGQGPTENPSLTPFYRALPTVAPGTEELADLLKGMDLNEGRHKKALVLLCLLAYIADGNRLVAVHHMRSDDQWATNMECLCGMGLVRAYKDPHNRVWLQFPPPYGPDSVADAMVEWTTRTGLDSRLFSYAVDLVVDARGGKHGPVPHEGNRVGLVTYGTLRRLMQVWDMLYAPAEPRRYYAPNATIGLGYLLMHEARELWKTYGGKDAEERSYEKLAKWVENVIAIINEDEKDLPGLLTQLNLSKAQLGQFVRHKDFLKRQVQQFGSWTGGADL